MSCPVLHKTRDSQATVASLPLSPNSESHLTVGSINELGNQKLGFEYVSDTSSSASMALLGTNAPPPPPAPPATSGTESTEKEFRKYTSAKVTDLFNSLRKETLEIENNIAIGEKEVLDRDQHAFMMRRHELSVAYMQAAHAIDLQKQKDALEAILVARNERKKAKKEGRKAIRASKRRDQTIQQQKKSADAAARIRESIAEKRAAFDALTQHMYTIHEKQQKNLLHSQERTFSNEKLLVDLETRHLKEEVRSTILKKFQVRQNHLGHLNKRINDNLREVQLMELRHSKEKFELEMVWFEEIGSKKIIHENAHAELQLRHQIEMHNEKESVLHKKEQAKEELLKKQHAQILKAMAQNQRIELRQLRIKHDLKISSGNASKNGSKPHSRLHSNNSSRFGSSHGSDVLTSERASLPPNLTVEEEVEEELQGEEDLKKEFGNISASLLVLAKRHKEEMSALESASKKEINDINLSFEVKMTEMEENHNNARIKLIEDQERDVEELKESQEKEIRIEEMMHDSEMKMLVERRILNSVLETVADGIINITPTGEITRFNHAAEAMFGYESKEVIGKNVKMLMPARFATHHDSYLNNYMTTGIKKALGGKARLLAGIKKDGTEFPMELKISEVKENDSHLFTGIVKDMTEIVEEQNYKQSTETQMTWTVDKTGKVLALNQMFKNYVGITTTAQEEAADVFSDQVVHPDDYAASKAMFAKANKDMKPFGMKRRLKSAKGTYRWFHTKAVPVYSTQGHFKFWVGGCTDIDDAEVLKNEMAVFQDKLPVFLWKCKEDGTIFYRNPSFVQYCGNTVDVVNYFDPNMCFAADAAPFQTLFKDAVAKRAKFEAKIRLKSASGIFKWFQVAGSPIIDGNGDLLNYFGICIDIDFNEKAAKEMEILPENLPQMIWKIDNDGKVLYSNSKFKKFVGAAPGSILNVFDKNIVHAEDYLNSSKAFERGKMEKKSFQLVRRLKSHDGNYFKFKTKGIPVFDDAQNIVSWYGTCTEEDE